MSTVKRLIALILVLMVMPAAAGVIVTDVPPSPDPEQTYLVYLHGGIIENAGPRPTSPQFGLYDYPAVLEALASRGAVVISAQRRPATNVNEYAGLVVAQVERLLQAGVPPEHVVVVGFSKGGAIAVHVSSFLRRPQVRFVLLAACWDRPNEPQLRLTGRVLSIYEESDSIGRSCKTLASQAEQPTSFEEIRITTGRKHGAFYTPLPEWVEPVLDWVHGKAD